MDKYAIAALVFVPLIALAMATHHQIAAYFLGGVWLTWAWVTYQRDAIKR